jgi:uncharacterized membrane protein YphA (DoxX/SURF4 family)
MVMGLALRLFAWSALILTLVTTCMAMDNPKSAESAALNSLVKNIPKLNMNNYESWKHQIAMAMMMICMSEYLGMDDEFDHEEDE